MTAATGTTSSSVVRLSRRRLVKIIVDVGLLVGFVTEFITREGPDYAVHSWIGIILVPIIGVHLAGSLGWISRVWARKRQDRDFNLGVLNAVLGMAAGICIVTGFPIWLEWSESTVWTTAHTISGFASIAVMLIHLWMNRSRIKKLLRQDVSR